MEVHLRVVSEEPIEACDASNDDIPGDVCGIEDCQPLVILLVGDVEIFFKPDDLGVADVGSIEERAEEEEGKDRQDSLIPWVSVFCLEEKSLKTDTEWSFLPRVHLPQYSSGHAAMVFAVGVGPLHLLNGGSLAHLVGIRSMIVRSHVSRCEVHLQSVACRSVRWPRLPSWNKLLYHLKKTVKSQLAMPLVTR